MIFGIFLADGGARELGYFPDLDWQLLFPPCENEFEKNRKEKEKEK